MSDSMLDTSMDAVLSRISKLENAVAMGSVTPRISAVQAEQPQEKELQKKDSDIAQVAEPPKQSADDTLKAMRGWNEIAEKAAAGDIAVLPFLKMAKAFSDANGKIYVRFPNDFAKSMVERAGVTDGIIAALCINLGRKIEPADVIFGVLVGDEDDTELDDLII